MNRELCNILKDFIAPLPFIDVLAGLVQTIEDNQPVEDGPAVRNRFPMSYNHNLTDACRLGEERQLIPDSSKKSIIYFEDNGSVVGQAGRNGDVEVTGNVRLVAWLNRSRLTGDKYDLISGYCMSAICGRLDLKFKNMGIFKRLTVRPVRFPPQDANLFSRYTYDETVRQFLMPPFEVFAIDFTANYMVNAGCISEVDFSNPDNC